MRGVPSARHEAVIPTRKFRRRGFAAELRRHTSIELGTQGRIIPDAFRFRPKRRTLTLIEVEVTHWIAEDPAKLWKLRMLRDLLADLGWKLRVFLGDVRGIYRPIDWETGGARVHPREIDMLIGRLGGRRP